MAIALIVMMVFMKSIAMNELEVRFLQDVDYKSFVEDSPMLVW